MITGEHGEEMAAIANSDGGVGACPSIQPHGVLIVLNEPELTIEHISENIESFIGIPARSVCGAGLGAIMRSADARLLAGKLRQSGLSAVNPYSVTLVGPAGAQCQFECTVQRRDGSGLIVELEPLEPRGIPVYADVQRPVERLQAAADCAALVATAASDIRGISGYDRVTIYRLDDAWGGDVIAEATGPGVEPSYFGQHFPPADVPHALRANYLRSRISVIADTDAIPARLVSRDSATAEQLDLSRATLRTAAPYQIAYLRNMGSRAAIVISIVIGGRLWGLISCLHPTPRRLDYATRAQCELLGHMLGWQLGLRINLQQQQRRTRETAHEAVIAAQLELHDDLASALIGCAPHLFEIFAADGVAARIGATFSCSGNAPGATTTASAIAARLVGERSPGKIGASHQLATVVPEFGRPAPAGALCIWLADDGDDFLLVFRPERIRSIAWGGKTGIERDGMVEERTSFEPWHEIVRDQSDHWTTDDIRAAESLAKRILLRLRHIARTRTEHPSQANAHLELRNAQAEALIKLQDDVAAALPSRSAVIDVILEFAQRQTHADASSLETFDGDESVFEAATGALAHYVGRRVPLAGSLSGYSALTRQVAFCNDAATELGDVERETYTQLDIASILVVPVTISDSSQVAIKVVSSQRWAFDDDDVQALKLAASNLLSALRAAQKFTALTAAELEQRTYARQLRALHAIASTTTSHRKDQIDAALHLGLEQLGLDWAFLGVIDYVAQQFTIESSVSNDDTLVIPNGTRMPLDVTIAGLDWGFLGVSDQLAAELRPRNAADDGALGISPGMRMPPQTLAAGGLARSKRVIIVDDVAQLSTPPAYGGWNSSIAVPLIIGGANYGAIGFTSRDVRTEPFSEANIEFIAVAGELIASAVERGLQRDQLEKSQTRYRALTEAIPQMMWVIDAADQFEYVNERWTKYTGLSLEHSRAVGRDGIYYAGDLDALGRGGPLPSTEFDCEVRLRRADGAYHWHLVRSVPFRGIAGAVDTWLVTATDIEARKSAETLLADVHDAALAATEAKSRFLATMSHEIRTPMNGVIGMTELLLLTPLNEEQREYTEVIRDSGQSLLRVLNDILDYSKIEAGKLELETVQFDLPGQVESVVELLRPGFTAKGVRLAMHIAPDVRTAVVGDPGRLRQILLNLAGNALKFTAPGGDVTITVSTSPADDDVSPVRFTIKDTGIGIPPVVLDRLFQPFSQGDESTTRKYGGTGLGLSISAELVALMGGLIGVDSIPDIGSEFWFVIPFQLAPNSQKVADARERQPKRSEPAPLRAERILLVEDNEINTFLALKQLQRLGFAVTAVTNGRQAVETVGRERYDLLLMDCHMPEMDGFEATRAIRRLESAEIPRLPIVAMTADARDEDHQNCLLAGMDDYISKPTNLDSLRSVLDRWLPAPERRRASRNGTSPSSSAPTLGMSMLLELFNGDRGAVLNLLGAALGSINIDLKRIEVAILERDFETVVEAAHRLKGTSGSIRSGRLVEISAAIESEARGSPPAISLALHAELRAAVTAVAAEIQQQRKGADSATLR